jgi:hypothetical protein
MRLLTVLWWFAWSKYHGVCTIHGIEREWYAAAGTGFWADCPECAEFLRINRQLRESAYQRRLEWFRQRIRLVPKFPKADT